MNLMSNTSYTIRSTVDCHEGNGQLNGKKFGLIHFCCIYSSPTYSEICDCKGAQPTSLGSRHRSSISASVTSAAAATTNLATNLICLQHPNDVGKRMTERMVLVKRRQRRADGNEDEQVLGTADDEIDTEAK